MFYLHLYYIGTNAWQASYWITGDGMDWANFSKSITGMGGPLSAAGPLGSDGPLGTQGYYDVCGGRGKEASLQ